MLDMYLLPPLFFSPSDIRKYTVERLLTSYRSVVVSFLSVSSNVKLFAVHWRLGADAYALERRPWPNKIAFASSVIVGALLMVCAIA